MNGGDDGWKQLERSERWDIGRGRYRVNLLDEPTWRLAYHDPVRRVSLRWQVFQNDWRLEEARSAMVAMANSIQRVREPAFAEIADRSRRQGDENTRKASAALAWLAPRGYRPLEPGVPITREGISVQVVGDPERLLLDEADYHLADFFTVTAAIR